MKFFIVDVFAETKYSGNQLAVFVCDRPLPTEEMQRIAREINFSESTFVLSEAGRDGGFGVRIFTPAHEVDFAGHPTLGTAHVIRRAILGKPVQRITLDLKAGRVPVNMPPEVDGPLWMDQIPPIFGNTLPKYFGLIQETWAKNILAFCPKGRTPTHDVSVRMFADYLGIPEDPATGSGDGCLAGYLVKHRLFGTPRISVTCGQGHEICRPKSSMGPSASPSAEGWWGIK